MQTQLAASIIATEHGRRADEILRACVHCGFCNATCPTYQVRRDELDGPRGRIYLIKNLLESDPDNDPDSGAANSTVRTHLDRCLTCRACETTCPSGVRYGELVEIGREVLERRAPSRHWLLPFLLHIVPNPRLLAPLLALGRPFRSLLPRRHRRLLHRPPQTHALPSTGRVLLVQGCVQRLVTPEVTAHLAGLLEARGLAPFVAEDELCCGGLALHLGRSDAARATMRENVERLSRYEADLIVSSASGCGVTLKDYGRLLGSRDAAVFAGKVRDVGQVLAGFRFRKRTIDGGELHRIAWHPPCTLQHGQQGVGVVGGVVEGILQATGYELVPVEDAHLCCGAAGSYSLLQPQMAAELKRRKASALAQHAPDAVATANIGCQTHLADAMAAPVLHWLELLA